MSNHPKNPKDKAPETSVRRDPCGCGGNCRGCPCQDQSRD